jgi:hypothetical protein
VLDQAGLFWAVTILYTKQKGYLLELGVGEINGMYTYIEKIAWDQTPVGDDGRNV